MTTLNTEQNILVFATPRSGSTFVLSALESFLARFSYLELYEYLAVNFAGVDFSDQRILIDKSKWRMIDQKMTKVQINREYLSKIIFLAASSQKWILKAFPGQLLPEDETYLANRSQIIFLERKDLHDQLLSYLISIEKNLYYDWQLKQIRPGSITATRDRVDRFWRIIRKYEGLKSKYQGKNILLFEDFIRDPKEKLNNLFDAPPGKFEFKELPQKQNRTSKQDLFTNMDQIRLWSQGK